MDSSVDRKRKDHPDSEHSSVEELGNPIAQRFKAILEDCDMHQFVNCPTHSFGGTLELIITRSDSAMVLSNVRELSLTDHFRLLGTVPWQEKSVLQRDQRRSVQTRLRRSFNLTDFRAALSSSVLCTEPLDAADQTSDVTSTLSPLTSTSTSTQGASPCPSHRKRRRVPVPVPSSSRPTTVQVCIYRCGV